MEKNLELVEIQKLEGHTDRVWSVAWNPVSSHAEGVSPILASCSSDNTIRIWEQSSLSRSWTCKTVLEETHSRTVRSCAWSPSGHLLATASFDGTTGIWKNYGSEFECISTLEIYYSSHSGHSSTVWAISFNVAGDKMVTCSDDLTLKIWVTDIARMQSGEEYAPWTHLCTLSGYHDRTICSAHWSRLMGLHIIFC